MSGARNGLMIARYIPSGDGCFGGVFASSGSVVEPFPHNQQPTGQLCAIQSVISVQECLFPSSDNETRYIHCDVTII